MALKFPLNRCPDGLIENAARSEVAYFPPLPVQVGVMCASPEGDGFEVAFEHYQLR